MSHHEQKKSNRPKLWTTAGQGPAVSARCSPAGCRVLRIPTNKARENAKRNSDQHESPVMITVLTRAGIRIHFCGVFHAKGSGQYIPLIKYTPIKNSNVITVRTLTTDTRIRRSTTAGCVINLSRCPMSCRLMAVKSIFSFHTASITIPPFC